LDQTAPMTWAGEWGVRTMVSECRVAEPNVSKFWEPEVKGWEMEKSASFWS
jgi:hypothetical protein